MTSAPSGRLIGRWRAAIYKDTAAARMSLTCGDLWALYCYLNLSAEYSATGSSDAPGAGILRTAIGTIDWQSATTRLRRVRGRYKKLWSRNSTPGADSVCHGSQALDFHPLSKQIIIPLHYASELEQKTSLGRGYATCSHPLRRWCTFKDFRDGRSPSPLVSSSVTEDFHQQRTGRWKIIDYDSER